MYFSEFSTSKEMDTDSELFASNILGAGETPRCNHYYRSWCDCTYGFFAKKLLGTKVIFVNSAADVTHASKTPVWIERYSDLFWSNGKRCGNYFLIQFVVVFYDFC